MKVFKICIEETVSQTFSVAAKDADEAMNIASEKYRKNEFVLEPGELIGKQMAIISPEEQATEWIEF